MNLDRHCSFQRLLVCHQGTLLFLKQEILQQSLIEVTSETAAAIMHTKTERGRIVAVGTTVVRALETASDEKGAITPYDGEATLYITPGYRFRLADAMLTNFHLPRTTLLMLVSAFTGIERLRAAYAEAIEERYRFYSYGDAMLII